MPSEFAEVLKASHAAVKVQFSWLGVRKTLDKGQKEQAANVFGAMADSLSASKRLFNTKHDAYKAVNRVKGEIVSYWKNNTLPFPEDGVRLLKREKLPEFQAKMTGFVGQLDQAVAALQEVYLDLREQAKEDLAELFNEADYPANLDGQFSASWHLVNTTPPDYLKETMPVLYRMEQDRIARQMETAVGLAEKSFYDEFSKLVTRLAEQIQGKLDGKVKRFAGGQLNNVKEFFDRFKELNLGSSEDLERLVEQAKQVCDGVNVEDLKENVNVQVRVKDAMADISKQLEGMVELRPARAVSFDDEE